MIIIVLLVVIRLFENVIRIIRRNNDLEIT